MALTPVNLAATNVLSTSVRSTWERWTPIQIFLAGEKGAWYDPSDLSTLFQDAAGTIPVTADGDPVGLMLDKSGNGDHASQSVSAKRMVYGTDGVLRWIDSDGIGAFLITSVASIQGNGSRTILVGALTEPTTAPISHIVHSGNDGTAGATFGLVSRTGSVNNLGQHYWNGSFNSGFSGMGTDVYSVNKNGSTETYRRATTNQEAVNTKTTTTGAGVYYLFSRAGGNSEYGNGKIYGIVIVDRALTASEMEASESYLANQAGVTL